MRREFLALLAPVLVVVVLPPLDLLTRNHEVLGLRLSMLTSLSVIGLAAFAVGAVFACLRSRHRLLGFCHTLFLLIAPGWIIYISAASYFGKGRVFPAMLIVIPAVAVAMTRSRRGLQEYLLQGCAIFSILLAVLGTVNTIHLLEAVNEQAEADRQAVVSNEPDRDQLNAATVGLPDIYHVIFDEFQTDMFEAALTDEDREDLGGFTFFPSASTPWGRTEMALGAILSGRPYVYKGEPYEYVHDGFHGPQSLITQLKEQGYYTKGLIHGVYPRNSTSPFHSTFIHKTYANVSGDGESSDLFFAVWLVASFPQYVVERILPPLRLDQMNSQTLLPASDPFMSVLSLRRFVREDLVPRHDGPQYLFIHLIVPHFPLVLDEHCNFRQDNSVTAEMQSTCAISLIVELIDSLKRTGRFESSLIFIHGDHGSSYSHDGTSLVRWKRNDPEWHKARSRPLLLVKPAGVPDSLPFRIDRRQTDLYDIYPTILSAVGADAAERGLIGQSLFHAEPQDRVRHYHFYQKEHTRRMIDGDILRYVVTPDGLEFDKKVPIAR